MASLQELLEKNGERLCKRLDNARQEAIRYSRLVIDATGKPKFDASTWQRFARQIAKNSIQQLLNECIFNELDRPAPCVIEDALDQLTHLLMVADREHGDAFTRFCTALLAASSGNNASSPFPIAQGCFANCDGGGDSFQVQGWPRLWDSSSGHIAYVILVAALPCARSHPRGVDECDESSGQELSLYARVGMRGTRRAFQRIEDEIKRILPSVFKTFMMAVEEEPLKTVVEEEPIEGLDPEEQGSDLPVIRLTDDSFDLRTELRLVVDGCMEAFYKRPEKGAKDSIDQRIRNAVILLAESDIQESDAVGLALSVTALEALVGQSGEGIAQSIAINIATLLEPEGKKRSMAEGFVKKLYKKRSRVLHGDTIDDNRLRNDARRLASGVLKALLDRRKYMRSCGWEDEKDEKREKETDLRRDLLKELEHEKYAEGQVLGVEESAVRSLWTQSDEQ